MKPSEFPDQLVAGPHMKVIGIGKLHLSADLAQIIRRYSALNGAYGSHIHKYGSLDGAMDGFHGGALCSSILCNYLIFHIIKPRHLPGQL